MKRQVKAPKSAEVKSPDPTRTEVREFGQAIKYMVEQMRKRWRNQIFEQLNKKTVEKFEDANQPGNFANVFLSMSDRVKKKLLKQFDDDRLKELAKNFTGKIDARNKKEFYERVSKKIGISSQELEATEGLKAQINAYKLETFQWIKKLRDDTLQEWTSNTLRQMAEGRTLEEILLNFDGMVEKRKNHAEMVARTQISTFNSLVSKTRARNLGIEKAIWVTSRDERVRKCHQARDGKEFVLSEGLYSSCDGKTLLPGTDYNCRCTYKMIIPEDDE